MHRMQGQGQVHVSVGGEHPPRQLRACLPFDCVNYLLCSGGAQQRQLLLSLLFS